MDDEPLPRQLPERTGRHLCIRCLVVVPAATWFANDHICKACAESEEYPPPPKPEHAD